VYTRIYKSGYVLFEVGVGGKKTSGLYGNFAAQGLQIGKRRKRPSSQAPARCYEDGGDIDLGANILHDLALVGTGDKD
jgi:hypothetical protein